MTDPKVVGRDAPINDRDALIRECANAAANHASGVSDALGAWLSEDSPHTRQRLRAELVACASGFERTAGHGSTIADRRRHCRLALAAWDGQHAAALTGAAEGTALFGDTFGVRVLRVPRDTGEEGEPALEGDPVRISRPVGCQPFVGGYHPVTYQLRVAADDTATIALIAGRVAVWSRDYDSAEDADRAWNDMAIPSLEESYSDRARELWGPGEGAGYREGFELIDVIAATRAPGVRAGVLSVHETEEEALDAGSALVLEDASRWLSIVHVDDDGIAEPVVAQIEVTR